MKSKCESTCLRSVTTADAPRLLLSLPGAAHRQAVHAVVVVRVRGVAWRNWGEVVEYSFVLFGVEDFASCPEGMFNFAKSCLQSISNISFEKRW